MDISGTQDHAENGELAQFSHGTIDHHMDPSITSGIMSSLKMGVNTVHYQTTSGTAHTGSRATIKIPRSERRFKSMYLDIEMGRPSMGNVGFDTMFFREVSDWQFALIKNIKLSYQNKKLTELSGRSMLLWIKNNFPEMRTPEREYFDKINSCKVTGYADNSSYKGMSMARDFIRGQFPLPWGSNFSPKNTISGNSAPEIEIFFNDAQNIFVCDGHDKALAIDKELSPDKNMITNSSFSSFSVIAKTIMLAPQIKTEFESMMPLDSVYCFQETTYNGTHQQFYNITTMGGILTSVSVFTEPVYPPTGFAPGIMSELWAEPYPYKIDANGFYPLNYKTETKLSSKRGVLGHREQTNQSSQEIENICNGMPSTDHKGVVFKFGLYGGPKYQDVSGCPLLKANDSIKLTHKQMISLQPDMVNMNKVVVLTESIKYIEFLPNYINIV